MYARDQRGPDFAAKAVMPDNSFAELQLSSYRGKYVLLFFYPLDFTFVCPSEIIAFDAALAKFEQKNAQVIGVSVDSHYTHLAWKNTPRKARRHRADQVPAGVRPRQEHFPQLRRAAGGGRGLARAVPDRQGGVVRHALINDLPIGRSVDEALRIWTPCSSTRSMATFARPTGTPAKRR